MLPSTLEQIWIHHNGDVFYAQCSACNKKITAMNFGVQFNYQSEPCIENISPACMDCENESEINRKWFNEYVHGDREKARQYTAYIDPNYADGRNLIVAARNNDNAVIKLLLQHQIKVDLSEALGEAALHGNLEGVKLFVEGGVDPLSIKDTMAWGCHQNVKEYLDTFILE